MKNEKISIKQSKFYKFTPCEGTLVNTTELSNIHGQKYVKKTINYIVLPALKRIKSTKIGAESKAKFHIRVQRNNRYEPQLLTVILIMRMTRKQLLSLMDSETKIVLLASLTDLDKKELKLKDVKRKEIIKWINIDRLHAFKPVKKI